MLRGHKPLSIPFPLFALRGIRSVISTALG
jgi:hypothetical protein